MGFRYAMVFLTALTAAAPAWAQRGDREGHEMKEVWRDMDVPPAPVLTPEEAMESFRVAPGFRVELVAAEPLVEDPVAMAWDGEGRIWVAEMRGFMPDVDGDNEDAPVGRVTVLEDTDGDGRMDESTVFLDGLVMPRAIAIVEDRPGEKGVLIAEPPNLWYCRDTDGDLKADEKTAVHENFGQQGPVEHTDNGLMPGLDNWMYNAKSSLRFKFKDGELITDNTAFRGQWGITQDDFGRLFTNSNSSYLHADLLPAEYLQRNPHFESGAGITERIVDDQSVHTIRVNPGINRGYMDHMLREDGRLARTTAVCGPVVYRGDAFPASYYGDVFVPEPSGNAVAAFSVTEEGISLRTEHKLYNDKEWDKREFLASTDERFRPVNAYTGPDGGLYLVDMYRGILQHKVYVTTFLRKQILERELDEPVGLGRIYRIVPDNSQQSENRQPNLTGASSRELVAHLSHKNGWWRDTAQRMLVQRADESAVEPLKSLAVNGNAPLGRIHALWTLHGIGKIDRATILAALSDPHPEVRTAALRTGEFLLAGAPSSDDETQRSRGSASPEALAFINRAVRMTGDPDPGVRLQVMFTLGEAKGSREAEAAMADLLRRHADDTYLRHAAISGLAGREVIFLQSLLENRAWSSRKEGYDNVLHDLAATIYRGHDPGHVDALLTLIDRSSDAAWQQAALLDGILGSAKEPKPIELAGEPAALASLANIEDEGVGERVAELRELITWPGDPRMADAEEEAEPAPLTDAQRALMEQGKVMYMATCMACHQVNGKGQAGMAPTLVDSEWATGSEERLIRIVLQGLQGPITVNDEEWNLIMPGHQDNPILTDERIAGILTYIRQSWGNAASPIAPEAVEKVREETDGRVEPWTAEELAEFE